MIFRNKIKGVTLIELVTVILIVGILAGASSLYVREVINLWRFISFRNEIVDQARLGLLRMTREMRQIANNTSVYIAQASRLNFLDYGSNNIDYYLSGNNLMRNSNILIKQVDDLSFTYYDNTSAVITSPLVSPNKTDIYRIKVSVDIHSVTQNKTLEAQVFPRNFAKKE